MPNYVFYIEYDPKHVGKRMAPTVLLRNSFHEDYDSANIQEIPAAEGIRWLFESSMRERELYSASPRKRLNRGMITAMKGYFRNMGYWLCVQKLQDTRGSSSRRR